MKKKFSDFIKIHIIPLIGFLIIFLLEKTIKWKKVYLYKEEELPTKCFSPFWHGHQLLIAPISKRDFMREKDIKGRVLISKHTDGKIISNIMKFFGIGTIEGSSSLNSKGASLNIIKTIENEKKVIIAITPDGPRGPLRKVKPGIIFLASATQIPIFPMACFYEKYWQFKSWDEMVLAKPFSKGTFVIGEGIYVPKDLSKEDTQKYCEILEDELNRLKDYA